MDIGDCMKFECKNCGKEFDRRIFKGRVPAFCSCGCHMLHKQKQAVENWLSSGVLENKNIGCGAPNSHFVRRHIIEQQNHKCSICSSPQEWAGKPMSFILDHVDGNSENNHRDNLRLICPNCESQTPTFKGRNKGNGRKFRRVSSVGRAVVL